MQPVIQTNDQVLQAELLMAKFAAENNISFNSMGKLGNEVKNIF